MANKSGGPWGGGPQNGGNGDARGPGRPGQQGPNIPDIDDMVRKGQERLSSLMGGRGGSGRRGGGGGGERPRLSRGSLAIGAAVILGLWAYSSLYSVRPEEQSVELFLGEFSSIGQPGLNFAPWPVMTYEVIAVTREQSEDIGVGRQGDNGLMLTTDENIVDIDFQVVWNISRPDDFLFNLRDGPETVRAVSESAMREIVAGSELAPLLNRDRAIVAQRAKELIQATLDSYEAGINVVRVNLNKADPPREVIDAFRDVQAAEQERDRLERQADAYANRVLAGARGESAQILEVAESYRAEVVNEAKGDASRFSAVLTEYRLAPGVTRRRLYIETLEKVLGDIDKIILDDGVNDGPGQGVVPYLPLNELRRGTTTSQGGN